MWGHLNERKFVIAAVFLLTLETHSHGICQEIDRQQIITLENNSRGDIEIELLFYFQKLVLNIITFTKYFKK